MKVYYNKKLKELARRFRNNPTQSERVLWARLRNGAAMGYDFHGQKPIENFIADFYCEELRLVIELDGYSHGFEETAERDSVKEQKLVELGMTVMRFSDNEVRDNMNGVLRCIEQYILEWEEKRTPVVKSKNTPPTPS